MSDWTPIRQQSGERALEELRQRLPLLIEIRFTRSGASSDWQLCTTDEELEELLGRIGDGHRLLAVSVDDLRQDGWKRLAT